MADKKMADKKNGRQKKWRIKKMADKKMADKKNGRQKKWQTKKMADKKKKMAEIINGWAEELASVHAAMQTKLEIKTTKRCFEG